MGSLHAAEFASTVTDGTVALDAALHWHLTSNHYPPVPASMIPACKAAIDLANRGDHDGRVELPDGVTCRGESTATAEDIIRQHHLWDFLASDDDQVDYTEVDVDVCQDCGRAIAAGFNLCIRCEQL